MILAGVAASRAIRFATMAGLARCGFDYRRCPGEQLTKVFEDLLREFWRDQIVFRKLDLASAGRVLIGPNGVVQDDIGFGRTA
jgi:hypothetical protein